jgi:hypothetical protein
MLAEFRAQDSSNSTSTTTSAGTTSRTSVPARMQSVTVSDSEILAACVRGDLAQLRR